MPRPRCCRRLGAAPSCKLFLPAGQPCADVDQVSLDLEEYEALRLADHEGLYHEEAATRMGVSRQTFGRTVSAARGKVARALVLGLPLRIEISPAEAAARPPREFLCPDCGYFWHEPCGTGRPEGCPRCGGGNFRRKGCESARPCRDGGREEQS